MGHFSCRLFPFSIELGVPRTPAADTASGGKLQVWLNYKDVSKNGWFIREKPFKMDDLGGFSPIFGNTQMLFLWFLHGFFWLLPLLLGLSGLGQAQISKLEADLTNALEVAKVAEAAATNATAMVAKQVASCRLRYGKAGGLCRAYIKFYTLVESCRYEESLGIRVFDCFPVHQECWQMLILMFHDFQFSCRVQNFVLRTRELRSWKRRRQQIRRTLQPFQSDAKC